MPMKRPDDQRWLLRSRAAFVRDMCEQIIEEIDSVRDLPDEAVERANAMFVAAIQGTAKGKVDDRILARRAIMQALHFGLDYRDFCEACVRDIGPPSKLNGPYVPSAIWMESLLRRLFGFHKMSTDLCVAALQAADTSVKRREHINALFESLGLEPLQERTEREMWAEAPSFQLLPKHPADTVEDVIRRHLGIEVKAKSRRM